MMSALMIFLVATFPYPVNGLSRDEPQQLKLQELKAAVAKLEDAHEERRLLSEHNACFTSMIDRSNPNVCILQNKDPGPNPGRLLLTGLATSSPSASPTFSPSASPTSASPTSSPSAAPTSSPSISPTSSPSISPTF